MQVSQFPATIHLHHGVESDQKHPMHALDREAKFIAIAEQSPEIEETLVEEEAVDEQAGEQ